MSKLRRDMWETMKDLKSHGTTIILTTHYIEEAELMADRIGIIAKGEIRLVRDKEALMAETGQEATGRGNCPSRPTRCPKVLPNTT